MPGFVYTIGLYQKFGQPKLICFGLKADVQATILNHACDLMKAGKCWRPVNFTAVFWKGIVYSLLKQIRIIIKIMWVMVDGITVPGNFPSGRLCGRINKSACGSGVTFDNISKQNFAGGLNHLFLRRPE